MEFHSAPKYFDLFHSESPDPTLLLGSIRSDQVIAYLSLINTQLYNGDEDNLPFQEKLLYNLLSFWTPLTQNNFLNTIWPFWEKHPNERDFFKSIYITYFINNELINYRHTGTAELTSLDEMNIIKAYFVYVERFDKENENAEINFTVDDPLFFQKLFWPYVIKQTSFSEKIDPIYQTIKLSILLEHFYLDPSYNQNVRNYLILYSKSSIWDLVSHFMALIDVGFTKRKDVDFYNFLIVESPGFTNILNSLSLNVEEYKKDGEQQKNYLGIRQKPLLKINETTYCVLNWKFLFQSVYTGVLFDFKNQLNISFNTYKSIVGSNIAEPKFFKAILSHAFSTYHCTINFSNATDEGSPDCYIRIGKYVMLIEFKDYLIPTKIIDSGSFDEIKKYIDTNFVESATGQKKGVSQLQSQMKILNNGGFSFDRYELANIKKRNLVVIPIIVTADFHFQTPGINNYLANILCDKIARDTESLGFQNIYRLSMLDLSFLYRQILRIKRKEVNLIELTGHFHKSINKKNNNITEKNRTFEECLPKTIRQKGAAQKENGFVEELIKAFNINPDRTNAPDT